MLDAAEGVGVFGADVGLDAEIDGDEGYWQRWFFRRQGGGRIRFKACLKRSGLCPGRGACWAVARAGGRRAAAGWCRRWRGMGAVSTPKRVG